MKRGRWGLALLGTPLLLARVSSGARASEYNKSKSPWDQSDRQRACCAAVVEDDAAEDHVLPLKCLSGHKFGCEPLRASTRVETCEHDEEEMLIIAAFEQQTRLREKNSCGEEEWLDRCPRFSTMLLSSTWGGCAAAGCLAIEGEPENAAVLAGDGAEEAILRAVVAQEADWISRGRAVSRRKKLFEQEEKVFLQELEGETNKKAGSVDMDDISRRLEVAVSQGFAGAAIISAQEAVARWERERKALACVRSIPGKLLSAFTTMVNEKQAMAARVERALEFAERQKQAFAQERQEFEEQRKLWQQQQVELEERLAAASAREEALAANEQTARGEIHQLKLELSATEEKLNTSQARVEELEETVERQLRMTGDAEGRLESCAEQMDDIVSRSASLASFAAANMGRAEGVAALSQPASGNPAPHDAYMEIRAYLDRVGVVTGSFVRSSEEERGVLRRANHARQQEVDQLRLHVAGLVEQSEQMTMALKSRQQENEHIEARLASCAEQMHDILSRSANLVSYTMANMGPAEDGAALPQPESGNAVKHMGDLLEPQDTYYMEAREKLDMVSMVTGSFARSSVETMHVVQRANNALQQDVNQLQRKVAGLEEQSENTTAELKSRQQEIEETAAGLVSCSSDLRKLEVRSQSLVSYVAANKDLLLAEDLPDDSTIAYYAEYVRRTLTYYRRLFSDRAWAAASNVWDLVIAKDPSAARLSYEKSWANLEEVDLRLTEMVTWTPANRATPETGSTADTTDAHGIGPDVVVQDVGGGGGGDGSGDGSGDGNLLVPLDLIEAGGAAAAVDVPPA